MHGSDTYSCSTRLGGPQFALYTSHTVWRTNINASVHGEEEQIYQRPLRRTSSHVQSKASAVYLGTQLLIMAEHLLQRTMGHFWTFA